LTLDSCYNDKYPVVDLSTPTTTVISFTNDIQPILDSNCIVCHKTGSGLPDFTTGNSYAAMSNLITAGSIIPGNATGSELMDMLNGVSADGKTMPPSGIMIPSKIALFANWINQGAKNN